MAREKKKTKDNTEDVCVHCAMMSQLTERLLNAVEAEMEKDGWRPCANWREYGFEVAAFRRGKEQIYIELSVGPRGKAD